MEYFSCLFFIVLVCSGISGEEAIRKNVTSELILQMVKALRWKDLTIVYDVEEEREVIDESLVNDLLHLLSNNGVQTLVYKTEPSRFQDDLLDIHYKTFPRVNILYMTSNDHKRVMTLMKIVNDIDFNSKSTTDFRVKSKWIILTSAHIIPKLTDMLSDLCHVCVVFQSPSGCYHLKTLERKENLNTFTYVKRLLIEDDIFPNVKFKHNGRKLVIGLLPFLLIKKRIVKGKVEYYGPMIGLLNDIALALNFTYILQEPKDGKWGVKTGNNTWDGLIGELQRREIDIVFAEYIITLERSKVMDFVLPAVFSMSIGIFYKNPSLEESSFTWISFLHPFKSEVFIFLFVSYILFCVLLITLDCVTTASIRKPKLYLFLNIFGCFCLEGGHYFPENFKTRILYVSWWIFCVIIASMYTGKLTSSLLMKNVKQPFTNLQELAEQTTWKYGMIKDSSIQEMFENSNAEENRNIWKGIMGFNSTDSSVLSDDLATLYRKVLSSRFALIDVFVSKFLANTTDCSLTVIDNILSNQYMAFAVSYNSTLKGDLEQIMYRLTEAGLSPSLTIPPRTHCLQHGTTGITAISLETMKGVFLCLLFGFMVASCILLVEFGVKNFRK